VFAIEGFGKDTRQGGLADPPGAGKQVGVVQPVVVQGVAERPHDMGLPHQFTEYPRTPLTG